MTSSLGELAQLQQPLVLPGAMHPCGPLAMATPLHTFPSTRLEVEEPLPPMSSHLLSPPPPEVHQEDTRELHHHQEDTRELHHHQEDTSEPTQSPTFTDPGDQAQFEADKHDKTAII